MATTEAVLDETQNIVQKEDEETKDAAYTEMKMKKVGKNNPLQNDADENKNEIVEIDQILATPITKNLTTSIPKNTNEESKDPKSCKSYFNVVYDVIAISISMADLTTDLYILYEYYTLGRTAFFIISLIVICLAQLAYCFAFTVIFSKYNDSIPVRCCTFISCLPFSPFLSFIFYFAGDSESKFSKAFLSGICGLNIEPMYIDKNASEFKKWVQEKLHKHIGFIMEAAVEAFPQSIIQMIAICVYQQADTIAILSIMLSMLSVASKSLIFSRSIHPLTFVWNWLSCITDFFGIFFAISWVFYNANDGSSLSFESFSLIGKIWIFKILICVLPTVTYIGLFLVIGLFGEFYFDTVRSIKRKHDSKVRQYKRVTWMTANPTLCQLPSTGRPNALDLQSVGYPFRWRLLFCIKLFLSFVVTFVGITIMFGCGVVFASLIAEIVALTYVAYMKHVSMSDRLPNSTAIDQKFWNDIFKFIQNPQYHKIYSPKDKLLRIIAVNKVLSSKMNDVGLKNYLNKHQNDVVMPYYEATWKEMYESSQYTTDETALQVLFKAYISKFVQRCEEWQSVRTSGNILQYDRGWQGRMVLESLLVFAMAILWFLLMPLYLLSRFLNVLLPIIIIIWLYVNDFWDEIDTFQYCMLAVYGFLLSVIIIMGFFAFRLQSLISYIMPKSFMNVVGNQEAADKELKRIRAFYVECKAVKPREIAVYQCFGEDIGKIILLYLPRFFDA